MLNVAAAVRPELDPEFVPAVLWNRAFQEKVQKSGQGVKVVFALSRPNGAVSALASEILPFDSEENKALDLKYAERLLTFLLWMKGGYKITVAGCAPLAEALKKVYCPGGAREFDAKMMGERIYGRPFVIESVSLADAPQNREVQMKLGGHLDGCRIGFDLGGSDRKCAAVIDGKVVHTEEVVWDPYFQKDPSYHKHGILDSLRRSAEKLPRVDGIGGSAAGVYVDNQPRLASLFRGVSEADFKKFVVPMFEEIQKEYGVPLVVANDGEVTALAGAISMESDSVLGISMGTSEAAGYVNPEGNITDYLNELAFAPVDYRENAPKDEWSGDEGCGVQYMSQQAVVRLAPKAGLTFAADMPFPKQLEAVQKLMAEHDPRARKIYETLGICFGYTVAHYASFYRIKKLLILGRVSSGEGGEVLIEKAREVLQREFPELAKAVEFRVPDETFKRHGQAVIAASLPEIR